VVALSTNWRTGEPDLAGLYGTYDSPTDEIRRGKALIKQHGRKVSIKVYRQINRAGEPTNAIFTYRGIVKSGVISASYIDSNLSYRIGAIVIKRTDSTGRLAGRTLYPDEETTNTERPVASLHFELRRDNGVVVQPGISWTGATFCWLWLGLG